jgi:hypothetical protein
MMNSKVNRSMISCVRNQPVKNQSVKSPLSKREWVELRNLASGSYVLGKNQLLLVEGARSAANLYRQNWEGCRDLWKLNYHRRRVNFTVL